ncbi:MAG: DNA-3-methyladenine glycosylase [Gammaproteobacteria bacterium]|nr:DNA-3-methyladenine glycosylase [Gammaproteobacteria bacterium]MDH5592342.1 DNA-3-methyladenine glycosylase [Gammaproteobacteria bacterium]
MLTPDFFAQDSAIVAQALLGKVLRHRYKNSWLAARIIETEAYYLTEKASHSSLGYTETRKAMFMEPGTIYMYYSRGQDSLNVSCGNEGDAVLIKAAIPYTDTLSPAENIKIMQQLNPANDGSPRPINKLCSGQTLLCRSLNLKVVNWNQKQFDQKHFYIEDIDHTPEKIIQTTRLGIHEDRDAHLMYRFVDFEFSKFCTSNPLTKRNYIEGVDYKILT